jgi:hypothetical protein
MPTDVTAQFENQGKIRGILGLRFGGANRDAPLGVALIPTKAAFPSTMLALQE